MDNQNPSNPEQQPVAPTPATPEQTVQATSFTPQPASPETTAVPNQPINVNQPPQKKSNTMNVVTILLLLFFPLFGIISMWVWTTWSKTLKWILTCVFLVVPILAIIAAISLVAINPSHQFNQADNTARRMDTLQILNAIGMYKAENKGQLPDEITQLPVNTPTEFASTTPLSTLCAKLLPSFIPAIPTDPSLKSQGVSNCQGSWKTGFAISRDDSNRVTVSALNSAEGEVIQVTR